MKEPEHKHHWAEDPLKEASTIADVSSSYTHSHLISINIHALQGLHLDSELSDFMSHSHVTLKSTAAPYTINRTAALWACKLFV